MASEGTNPFNEDSDPEELFLLDTVVGHGLVNNLFNILFLQLRTIVTNNIHLVNLEKFIKQKIKSQEEM